MRKISILFILIGLFSTAFAQNRIVLVEHFTNASCSNCAFYNPQLFEKTGNHSDIAIISYPMSFPGPDSMYAVASEYSDVRKNYYSIFGTPTTIIDGNYARSSTSNILSSFDQKVTDRKNEKPLFDIDISKNVLEGKQLTASVDFEALADFSDNVIIFVVAIEKKVLRSDFLERPGFNNETEFHYVMRSMFPSQYGEIINTPVKNSKHSIDVNWNITHVKNPSELHLVAFAQNANTMEIYQANMLKTSKTAASLKEYPEIDIIVYPNPVASALNIDPSDRETEVKLYNPTGQLIYQNIIHDRITINTATYLKGIYYLHIRSEDVVHLEKIIIQ